MGGRTMNKEMDRFGVGPKFTVLGVGYGIIIYVLHYTLFSALTFTLVSRWVNIAFGIILILIGLPLFVISGIMVHRHINRGELCTTGVYAYFRHPLYAAWVVFIIPGIVIITGSIIAISLPVFLYLLFKIFTVDEEKYLREKFGNEYVEYEKGVKAVFPKIWKKYRSPAS
jgi:protein-S-isoprenylcysteine O-methyltransferase Ste14